MSVRLNKAVFSSDKNNRGQLILASSGGKAIHPLPGVNRVGGKVALPVPPHHRAYGSVHGGSCELLHGPELIDKIAESPLCQYPVVYGRVHVRSPGIPPGS